MKLAWASPFMRASAIGRVSSIAIAELQARGHSVDAIRLERDITPSDDLHALDCSVRNWRTMNAATLARYDLVIVNLGDNFLFHAGAFALLRDAPCLAIFHDFFLFNLFNGWFIDRQVDLAQREAEIVATYGPGARAIAQSVAEADIAEVSAQIPMTEWFARRCAGAMGHAQFYLERLERNCPGPVATTRLASHGYTPLTPPARDGAARTMLTLGIVNPNKCVDRVIDAIAADPHLRETLEYRVVGAVTDAMRAALEGQAKRAGYEKLTLLGAVDHETLVAEFERADMIACLRKPILEGASGSAIEGMLSARPVIVADAGFYADLPDDLVVKVPASLERAALTEALARAANDAPMRRSMGARAAAWAHEAFAIGPYIDAVETLAAETIGAGPKLAMAGAIGADLAALGLGPHDPNVQRIAGVLNASFNPRPTAI
jgi:glycosyltransferase involved in cell wall biosynthesis